MYLRVTGLPLNSASRLSKFEPAAKISLNFNPKTSLKLEQRSADEGFIADKRGGVHYKD